MTALYIILGILFFLFVLSLCSVKFYITYTDKLHIKIKYFFTFSLDDKAKTKKAEKSNKPKKPKSPKKKKPEKKKKSVWRDIYDEKGVSGLINVLKYIISAAKKSSKTVINHLIVNKLKILITVADEDAAETAVKYGRVCSVIYPLVGVFLSIFKCKSYETSVRSDFNKKETETDCFAYVKIRLIFIIIALIQALFGYIFALKKAETETFDDAD